jgi:hypothetical protein
MKESSSEKTNKRNDEKIKFPILIELKTESSSINTEFVINAGSRLKVKIKKASEISPTYTSRPFRKI